MRRLSIALAMIAASSQAVGARECDTLAEELIKRIPDLVRMPQETDEIISLRSQGAGDLGVHCERPSLFLSSSEAGRPEAAFYALGTKAGVVLARGAASEHDVTDALKFCTQEAHAMGTASARAPGLLLECNSIGGMSVTFSRFEARHRSDRAR